MRIVMIAAALLAGCSYTTQTTSGADYVAASPAGIDPEIARAAAVEPALRLPARIGVAKIMNGGLALPGAEEAILLSGVAERQSGLGSFIPISPIVLEMATGSDAESWHRNSSETVRNIRIAAARQHLDLVLIYEIGTSAREGDTPFAIADVTLIAGAFLPTRTVRVAGTGVAMLIDVRTGYPYGTAQVREDLSGLARSFGTQRRSEALQERASLKVVRTLVPEVEKMLAELASAAGG